MDRRVILYIGLSFFVIGISGLVRGGSNDSGQLAMVESKNELVSNIAISSNADGTIINYAGVYGENVLDLLRSGAEVILEDASGAASRVAVINGVSNSEDLNWRLYVNQQPAGANPSSLLTRSGDQVEWRLEQ